MMERRDHGDCARERSADIGDWGAVTEVFTALFDGLGELVIDEERVRFFYEDDSLVTGIALSRDGKLAASMPLHGVEASFSRLSWDERLTCLRLEGAGASYSYRIPPALLERRRRDS